MGRLVVDDEHRAGLRQLGADREPGDARADDDGVEDGERHALGRKEPAEALDEGAARDSARTFLAQALDEHRAEASQVRWPLDAGDGSELVRLEQDPTHDRIELHEEVGHEVKAQADAIVATSDENGVAEALERFVLVPRR